MPFITCGNRQVHFIHNNRKKPQPAVILVHGAGGRSQSWPNQWQKAMGFASPTVRRWVTDYPIYIIDLPGHGKSDGPAETSVAAYAQVVVEFATALGLQSYVVAGHSMGAAIGLTIGVMQPEGLVGIITFGGGAMMPVSDMILDGLQSDFAKTVELITKFSWQKTATAAFKVTSKQHMLTTPADVVHGDFVACAEFDVRDRLEKIAVPTLVVGGSADKMMPLHYSEQLAEQIPNAELVVINDAGHFMQFEKTAQTTQAVVKFLASIEKSL